jgi:hypothetical protein
MTRATITPAHSPAISAMMLSWDSGDRYGSARSMGYALAQVAGAMGETAIVNILEATSGISGWPSLERIAAYGTDGSGDNGDIEFAAVDLANAVEVGHVTVADMTFAARVLSRYLSLSERAGLAY